jgi:hypothetical protein
MDRLIDEHEAAAMLNVAVGTLRVWRCKRRYPLRYVKVGRRVRYRVTDIESFATANTKPGSATKGGKAK